MDRSNRITIFARAKLNLYLHVTGRREDGYHLLDSLVTFADIHDLISAEPAAGLTLQCDGPFAAALPDSGDNLVLRAARVLQDATGITEGAALTLTKNLPVASGIGGGSADAAAVFKALTRLWGITPGTFDLSSIALDLGADVPVCLFGRTTVMRGIGENLEATAPLPETALVLVNPGVAVSTPAVFKARTGDFSQPVPFGAPPIDAAALASWLDRYTANDLMVPAIAIEPVIGKVIDALRSKSGCLLARMSGSGATCFGLFATAEEAALAAAEVARDQPSWWVHDGQVSG